jgi:phosphatidylglycerophosphate synthase
MDTIPSVRELRERLQQTAPEGQHETYVGRTVRFFSIYLTRLFIRTSLTPNQLTILSVVVFLCGVTLFIVQLLFAHILGVILVYLSIVIDACDGELARWRKNTTGVGAIYVEPLSHDIQYGLMFFPLSWGAYLATGSLIVIYAGFTATVAKLLYRFLQIRFWYVVNQGSTTPTGELEDEKGAAQVGRISLLFRLYKFFNRNVFSSVGLPVPLLIFVLLGRVDWFVYLFAAAFLAIFLANFLRQVRYILRMRASP